MIIPNNNTNSYSFIDKTELLNITKVFYEKMNLVILNSRIKNQKVACNFNKCVYKIFLKILI